ncbi:alpha/beta fold hydrolase [Marinomonas agarivorans]|nr:alpha/beta fold hydrolase [Marinomonas agarivorans]
MRFCLFTLVLFFSVSLNAGSISFEIGESFDEYLDRVSRYLDEEKRWINSSNKSFEKAAVMPFDIKASDNCSSKTGILFLHGLSDSPYSLKSLSQALKTDCVWVRGVLLDGHGTKAEDLLDVSRNDWRKTVKTFADDLSINVDKLYVVGFSTGGGLALDYAATTKIGNLSGLVLISPLLKINSSVDWLLVALSPFLNWLDNHESDDYAKYLSVPVPAMKEVYKLAGEVRKVLIKKSFEIPVFIAASMQDATLDTSVTLNYFSNSLVHPLSEMKLYDANAKESRPMHDKRVQVMSSYYNEFKISSLSHLAVHISPDDPHYGKNGDYRNCSWYIDKPEFQLCKSDLNNWYGEQGDLLKSKSEYGARITWNPAFNELVTEISGFIERTSK